MEKETDSEVGTESLELALDKQVLDSPCHVPGCPRCTDKHRAGSRRTHGLCFPAVVPGTSGPTGGMSSPKAIQKLPHPCSHIPSLLAS